MAPATLVAMATAEQTLSYSRPSALTVEPGRVDLLLSTSGGVTPAGAAEHPRFFDDFLGHPEQSAQALLTVARVARTRFYTPPNSASRSWLLDPVDAMVNPKNHCGFRLLPCREPQSRRGSRSGHEVVGAASRRTAGRGTSAPGGVPRQKSRVVDRVERGPSR